MLSTACTAGSVALPPSAPIPACPATRANTRPSERPLPTVAIPATAWRKKTDSYSLVSVDPRSFEERGRALSIGTQEQAWRQASSPDGRFLAVGGDRNTIEIIDSRGPSIISRVAVGQSQSFLQWPHPHRLMAVTGAPGVGKLKSAVIVQPTRGSITARQEISGSLVEAAASEDTLAVLTATPAEESPRVTDLRVVRASGDTLSVRLHRIGSGFRAPPKDAQNRFGHYASPGLAIEPNGNRAFVFGVDRVVAEVSLADGTVSYRRLAGPPPSLALGPADAKLSNYSQLSALSLPSGLVVVFGHDQRLVRPGRHRLDQRLDPAGVVLFDPEDGSACLLHARADSALMADEVFLLFTAFTNGADEGMGVAAYTMNGERLWHRFGDDAIDFVQALNGYAYVTRSWRGWDTAVVELSTGRVVDNIRGRPADLVGAQSTRPGINGLY